MEVEGGCFVGCSVGIEDKHAGGRAHGLAEQLLADRSCDGSTSESLRPGPSSGVASCPCCGLEIAGVRTVQACRRAQWASCGLLFFAVGLAGDGDGLIAGSNHDLN